MLVIIRDQPALNGIADGLPTLVVLIENMASLNGCVLINNQQCTAIKRQFLTTGFIAIQQATDGVTEPVGTLIPAMR